MTAFSVPITRRLVEEDLRAAQPVGAQLVALADLDLGAELLERVEVRVEAAAADHVAARRRHDRAAAAARAAGRRAGTTRGCGRRAPRRPRA